MTEIPPRYESALRRAVDLAAHRHHRIADSRHLLRVLIADLSEGRTSTAWLLHDAGVDPVAVQDALESSLALVETVGTQPKPARMLTRVVDDAAALAEQRPLSPEAVGVLLVVCLGDPVVVAALDGLDGLDGPADVGTRLWDRVAGLPLSHPHAS